MIAVIQFYIPILIFFLSLFIFFKIGFDFNFSKSKTNFFIIIWISIWTWEYWLLGPYSFIRYYDEADIGLSRLLYDINHHLGGSYLHGIQGGTDFYAAQLIGGQYFSLERMLFTIFPIWIALFIHKLLLVSFSMIGTFLLVRKTTAVSRFQAYCFGAFFSLYNGYLSQSTLQHGLGYALLPVCVYVFCYLSTKNYYLLLTTIFSIFISFSISATHSFLVILFGILFSPIIIKIHNYKKFLLSLTLLILCVAINWSEALYGMATYGQESSRAMSKAYFNNLGQIIFGSFNYLFGKTDMCFPANCYLKYSPVVMLVVYVLILGIVYRLKNLVRFLFVFGLIFLFPGIIYLSSSIPYLDFMKSINFNRISYAIVIPTFLLAGTLIIKYDKRFIKIIPILFLCVAVFLLARYKINNFSNVFWGNQVRLSSIPNLVDREHWEPDKMYRAVTTMPYIHFHPNFLWAYGIDTLDGYTNLIPKTFTDFWYYGLHKNKFILPEPSIVSGNLYINYTEMSEHNKNLEFDFRDLNLKNSIDINMLRITNTGYIFSFFPIISEEKLNLISGPNEQPYRKSDLSKKLKNFKYYKNRFFHFGNLIFNPPKMYIYELEQFSDRFFFPEKIFYLNSEKNIRDGFNYISENYNKNSVYTFEKDIFPAAGEIIYGKKIKNGYEIKVNVEQEGIFVFNAFFSPYWKVYINNEISRIYNLFDFHTGVKLNKGNHVLKLKYERELLREKIGKLLN